MEAKKMNKNTRTRLILSVISLGILSAGALTFADYNEDDTNFPFNLINRESDVYTHGGMMNGYSSDNTRDVYTHGGMMNGYSSDNTRDVYTHGGMMSGYSTDNITNGYANDMMNSNQPYVNEDFDKNSIKDIEELKRNVERYLDNYSEELRIEDIFIYSNSSYYFSIVEEKTSRGAMELLVNPITGDVYPEYGPNMMWNTKFGIHDSSTYGSMMNPVNFDYSIGSELTDKEALEKANEYLSKLSKNLVAEKGGHAFYGYYTFHINEGENLKGMISVNSYTGEVWYHTWHGDIIDLISQDH
jgi:hypothetical protein